MRRLAKARARKHRKSQAASLADIIKRRDTDHDSGKEEDASSDLGEDETDDEEDSENDEVEE